MIIDARMCKIAPSGPLINSVNHRYGNVKWLPYLQEIIISISPPPFLFSDVLPTHHRLFYQRTKSDNNHIMDSLLRHVLSCFWLTRVLALQRLGCFCVACRSTKTCIPSLLCSYNPFLLFVKDFPPHFHIRCIKVW